MSIPALRSNLLDQIKVNIFFWYLLKHSRFSLASYFIPKRDCQALSQFSDHRYVSSSCSFLGPLILLCPPPLIMKEELPACLSACVCLSVCLTRPNLGTQAPDSLFCLLGKNLLLQMPSLLSATINDFFFIVSPNLKKVTKNTMHQFVYFFLGYLNFSKE